MDSDTLFSPVSPLSPVPSRSMPTSSPHERMHPYSTPAHEGLQAVEHVEPVDLPSPGPYSYQGKIQPDVVPLSILGERYHDDALLPCYPERRIWGLAVRTFWTIVGVAILLVVIAVAVGAGVGGSQAAKHAKEAKEAAAASIIYLAHTISLAVSYFPLADSSPSSSSVSSSITSSSASATIDSSSAATTTSSPTLTSSSVSSTASSTSSSIVGATPVPISSILSFDCPNVDGSTYHTSASASKKSFKITCSSNIKGNDIGRTMAPSLNACMEDCAAYASGGSCTAIVFNANLTRSTPIGGNCYFKNSSSSLRTGSYKLQASAILQKG